MVNSIEIFENAINHWRDNKGIGTAIIPYPINDKLMVLGVLQKMYSRSSDINVVIVTNSFNERQSIIEFITNQENSEENNDEFKNLIKLNKLKVFTQDYVINNKIYNKPILCIWYRPDNICQEMLDYISACKFKLVVLNKISIDYNNILDIYKIAPILPDFQQNEIEQIRLSTPVEETQIGIDIPADSTTYKLLEYYDEYIATSMSIFGSLDVMQQANIGNLQLNISSTQICYQIAKENGWNDHLDMSVDFNLSIDELYNPINLKERASKTYEIIRERNKLLSDFEGKLDIIVNIIRNNKDKKILIINKRAEFANVITEFINNSLDNNPCANYHDKVGNIPAIDIDGTPIFYKSGSKKGERKVMCAQAQKTFNVKRFNNNYINILSTNNAPDKDLEIDVDIVIITSPTCEDIKSYIYRLSKIYFRSNKIELYSLYCRNTSEQKIIENKEQLRNHNVKNSYNDENDFDFAVAE